MYVYIKSEKSLWTVGFYTPNGHWESESDHESPDAAAERVHWLNGASLSPFTCPDCGGDCEMLLAALKASLAGGVR